MILSKREETLISVVIPTFNRKSSISHAVNSVIHQDYKNWELLIVDDGSNDGTGTLLEPFLQDSRISYFYQNNQGVSAARNAGALQSKGNYLIFLDSDDVFFPKLLSTLYLDEFFKYDLIFWEVCKITDGKMKIIRPVRLGAMYNNIKATFLAGSICFRKSVFFKAGGYDPLISFSENYELGLRISKLPKLKTRVINKILLKYETNSETRVSNSLENRLFSSIYQVKKHKKYFDANKREKGEMIYLIAYLLEQSNRKLAAIKQYKKSWILNPLNIKALVKILILQYSRT